MSIRWRTSTSADSVVRYGTSAASLTQTARSSTLKREHEVRLSGLLSNTTYYYSVGSSSTTLASGTGYFFVTAPTGQKPTRIWVLGDSGTANADQAAVRDAYYRFTGSRHTDLWLMLGDNAYTDGTDSQYQTAVFNVYSAMLRKSVLWSTLGNHDGHTASSSSQTGPYYSIFTLPRNGEAGGVASGTEAYHSFDYGNIHFVNLNSYDVDRSSNGAMLTWLRNDLAANTKDWLIAFFHHPPYSKGSHNSDTESQLVDMRKNALPILERHGVDLVLTGHSHSYERSMLLDGHYGHSSTLNRGTMVLDEGSGREDGSGPYRKSGIGPVPNDGSVYVVAGASSKATGGALNHPAMFVSLNVMGSLVVDVDGSRLDARYLDKTGARRDYFTILKGASGEPPPPSSPPPPTGTEDIQVTLRNGSNGYNGMTDANLRSDAPTSNDGSATTLLADGSPDWCTVMRWDLSSIPVGKTVTAVTLTFNVENSTNDSYELYALKRAFSESSVTWQRASSLSTWQVAGAAGSLDRETTALATVAGSAPGSLTVSLNAAGVQKVQSWIDAPSTNFGFVLVDYTTSDGLDVSSSEATTVSARPSMTITYR